MATPAFELRSPIRYDVLELSVDDLELSVDEGVRGQCTQAAVRCLKVALKLLCL